MLASAALLLLGGWSLTQAAGQGAMAPATPAPRFGGAIGDARPVDVSGALPALDPVVKAKADALFDDVDDVGETRALLVLRDGDLIYEHYGPGFDRNSKLISWSMAKSITAVLTGFLVADGQLALDGPAPVAAWQRSGDPRGEITLNHLLHMASGLYTESGRNPQGEIYGSGAPASEVSMNNIIDAKPGERYVYAGSDTILATRAVREAFNNDVEWTSFPHRELLWKLGMTRTLIETDWTGDFITSGQCWSTARDFGRFGLLYLNDGVWNGERILPTGWSDYVSTLAQAQPASRARGGAGYGAQFWIYGGMDGLPDLAYSPGGALGQYAMIIPEKNVVIVRRGLDRGDGFKLAKFSADILKALGL